MKRQNTSGKTIGAVEKLTGIPKRKLKYYIERGLITPTQKSDSGYWLYSDQDIRALQLISLCQELSYTDSQIRDLLTAQDPCWQTELERHTARLREDLAGAGDRLLLAEYLRYRGRTGDGGLASMPAPEAAAGGPFPAARQRVSASHQLRRSARRAGRSAYRSLCRALAAGIGAAYPGGNGQQDSGPDSPQAQAEIEALCHLCRETDGVSPEEVLFALRLAGASAGAAQLLDALLDREGAVRLLTEAAQIYCDRQTAAQTE